MGDGRDWSADDVTRMAPDCVPLKSIQWCTKIKKIVSDMIERVEGIHRVRQSGEASQDGR